MKKALFIMIFCYLILGQSSTLLSAPSYIGFFADGDHQAWCITGSPVYEIEMWIWMFIGNSGLLGVNFYISYPDNIVESDWTVSPSLVSCCPSGGCKCAVPCPLQFCFGECQTDWVWLSHITLYVNSSEQTTVEIIPYPIGADNITFWSCDETEESAITFTHLYVNFDEDSPECLGTSTHSASWGAIKNIYSK